jgi:hydroxymethylglutaryl-CoA reductase
MYTRTSVISTRRVWYQSVISTRKSVISTRRVLFIHVMTTRTNVITTRTSVILTRTRGISTRKVQFPPAECDLHTQIVIPHVKCNFYTQDSTGMNVITTCTSVIYERKVWF